MAFVETSWERCRHKGKTKQYFGSINQIAKNPSLREPCYLQLNRDKPSFERNPVKSLVEIIENWNQENNSVTVIELKLFGPLGKSNPMTVEEESP